MQTALKMQPEDVILRYDSICLDHLISVSKASEKLNAKNVTAADIKATNKALSDAIEALDELIVTYESDRLL